MTFLKDGTHVELFFIVLADGQAGIGMPPPGMERDRVATMLRQALKENNAYGIVHVVEAWTYFPKQPDDHTVRQILQGEIAVSELKPEERQETLLIHHQTRAGLNVLRLNPIVRSANQPVALAAPIEWRDPPDGRFGKLFEG